MKWEGEGLITVLHTLESMDREKGEEVGGCTRTYCDVMLATDRQTERQKELCNTQIRSELMFILGRWEERIVDVDTDWCIWESDRHIKIYRLTDSKKEAQTSKLCSL